MDVWCVNREVVKEPWNGRAKRDGRAGTVAGGVPR